LIAASDRLTVCLLGLLQALLVALREFLACVGKPKKITWGSFDHNDMRVIKTVCGERGGQSCNVHLRVRIEMRDEFVPVPTHLFGKVRELGLRHFQVDKKAGFKGGWVSDNVTPAMFVLVVAKQLAPFKHGYVEKVVANLSLDVDVREQRSARPILAPHRSLAIRLSQASGNQARTINTSESSALFFSSLLGGFPTPLV
jgi:hypothetical protein